uniref:Uncharacterized protein AlNc14C318G10556 n=1 Tax=Albugo laibachii Nc14 TaxID=890382 RepID=F0WWC1_9STRA|nr:conserved hypothetical protein [Albugo laibachii Nc14]|eukprot:CCA25741.1 conserved hypothetical protein [Albugo laibachii Nc14]
MALFTRNRVRSVSIRNPERTNYIQRMSADVFGIDASLFRDRSQWIRKCDVKKCHVCSIKFSLWKFKHHCRSCGNVACGSCSSRRVCFHSKTVRVCDDCVATKLVRPYHVQENVNVFDNQHSRLHPSIRRHSIANSPNDNIDFDHFVASLQLHAPVNKKAISSSTFFPTERINAENERQRIPVERVNDNIGHDRASISFKESATSHSLRYTSTMGSFRDSGYWNYLAIKVIVFIMILVLALASI